MALWDLFRKRELVKKEYAPYTVGPPWLSSPERTGDRNKLSAYNENYAIYGIALRIAMAVSEVKWRLYKGNERSERNQIADHPILKLLDFANEFQTGQEITELFQLHLDLAGRGFLYCPRNSLGVPSEIWVIPPHQMGIIKEKGKFIAGYIYNTGQEKIPIRKEEIIYLAMPNPLDPYGGTGFVEPLSVEIDSLNYANRWNRNFFYNSARADAVLEYEGPGDLSENTVKEMREQWGAQHQGLSRSHKIAILKGGLKYKQIQINPKDMDFAALKKGSLEAIMFGFGMPKSVMGITEDVNRANAEAGEYTFARWLVKPRLTRIKNKLNEQLIPMFSQATGVELDFDEVVPETMEMKRLLAESGMRSGFMTVNEARKLNGLDPLPPEVGEILLTPLNLIPTPVRGKAVRKGFGEAQKESIWRAYIQKTERIEQQFITILRKLWNDQEAEVKNNLKQNQTADGVLFNEDKANETFALRLQPLLALSYESGFEETKQLNPLALAWLSEHSLLLAKGINATTLKALRAVLVEGFTAGESIPKLARRITGVYEEADRTRSLLIARTEVITASSKGNEDGYRELGVEKVEWYTALDERTCEECMALHGTIYPIGEGERPALHPQCRCVILPVS